MIGAVFYAAMGLAYSRRIHLSSPFTFKGAGAPCSQEHDHEKAPPFRRTAAPEHANLLSFYLAGRLPYASVRLPSQETASIRVEPSG